MVPLYLIIFTLVPSAFFRLVDISFAHFIFFPSLFIGLIVWIYGRKMRIEMNAVTASIQLFILYCLVHSIFVVFGGVGVFDWLRYTSVFLGLFVYFIAAPKIVNEERFRKTLLSLIVASTLVVLAILMIQLVIPSERFARFGMFGPKHSGLYASKLYIPVTVILIGLWVFNSRIVPRRLLYILIGVHLFRLVIDLRKAPIAAVLLGLLSIVCLAAVIRLFQKSGRLSLPVICRGRIAVVLLVPLLTMGLLMILIFHGLSLYESTFFDLSSGPGALLKGYSWRFHYEQFERYGGNRIIDYHAALSDPRWNPIFGAGLGTKFDLIEANRIHSLYVFILAHMGIAGLLLLFLMMVATFGAGIRAAIRSNTLDRFGNYIALTSAFVSYAAFFTFSVRGTDFEAMIIFSVLAGLITEHIALGRHRPKVAGMPE